MRRLADDVPARIGPAEFSTFGALIAVRCPHDLDHLMRRAGGQWEPGSRRWLIERRRIGPLVRALRWHTDPLFRRAGVSLDEAAGEFNHSERKRIDTLLSVCYA